ncbi:MAG TPA: PAS domain S-box protein [Flavipsychrobacter sp.]|nr:PAS domain S-box protein [Flavipsychrobacter sp.]
MIIRQLGIDTLFKDSPIPMWIFDLATLKFLYVNDAACNHYGYCKDEFLNMTIREIRIQDDTIPILELASNEKSLDLLESEIWQHVKRNGEVFYVRVYFHPVEFDGRKGQLVQAIDINENVVTKKINKGLNNIVKKQKEQIDNILSSVNEVIWSMNADDQTILYINDASIKVYGFSPDELIGTNSVLNSQIHPDDKGILDREIEKLFTQGNVRFEIRAYTKSGEIRYLVSEAVLTRNSDGEPDVINGVTMDVTSERIIENALKEKNNEITKILDSITDGFYTVDKNWNITYVNKEFELIFEKKEEDILGKNLWEVFPKVKKSVFCEEYRRSMEERVSVHCEALSPSAKKWLSAHTYPIENGLAIYLHDVTEEKKLREKIGIAEQNLRAIINNTKDVIWSVDRQFNIVSANQVFWDKVSLVTGRKQTETQNNFTVSDFSKELANSWIRYFERAFNGETFKIVEETFTGEAVTYQETSFNPIVNNNEIVGVSCFSRDISEEKRLHEKILKDEQNLRSMIDNTDDLIWSVDKNYTIITANNPYKAHIKAGIGKEIAIGKTVLLKEHGEKKLEKWLKHYSRALNGETFTVIEETIYNNAPRYAEIRFNPIYNQKSEVVGISCLSRNITERRKQLQKIELQNQKLKEIAWIQSHKVRNHVASILGLLQLYNDEDATFANNEVIDGIRTAATDLDDIIKKINDNTKIAE